MFTDIVGFSATMQRDEVKASRMRKKHREVFKDAHARHDGKILQYFGDGTLSIFTSATAAVECAVEMQVEFRKDPQVPLRIGINTGDITYDDEGAYGDGMNIASRIENVCVPGAVYVSQKVYTDIKNHPWLRAVSLGYFELRNIISEVELYAITSKGMVIPEIKEEVEPYPSYSRTYDPPRGGKNKTVAGFLAMFLGVFGVHKFYLGQRKQGMFFLIATMLSFVALAEADAPLLGFIAIFAFIQSILLFAMPQKEFDRKYNAAIEEEKVPFRPAYEEKRRPREVPVPPRIKNPYKKSGIARFISGNYEKAIIEFEQALEVEPKDIAVHFNLACCHSMLRNTDLSFQHLSKAVEFGFDDFGKIYGHKALEYLRSLDEFEAFVDNDYKVISKLPSPKKDLLDSDELEGMDLLDQIAHLGDLMEKGVLTRDEFDEQKKKLLAGE